MESGTTSGPARDATVSYQVAGRTCAPSESRKA